MIEIEESSGNVYADLNLPDATEMQIKSSLVGCIGEIINQRGLTEQEAAGVIGIEQPGYLTCCAAIFVK